MHNIHRFTLIMMLMILSSFQQPKKTRVVFFGDSITQAGVEPGGYITMARELAAKGAGAGQYEMIGAGIGGNKVYDLYLRMDDDVIARDPQVVVIYVGVNDVWHKQSFGTGTDADKFEKFYTAIIRKLQQRNIKVVLATPAVVGERTDFSNELDGDLNRYSSIIRDLAAKNNLRLVDLRKAFLEYNLANNQGNKESGILTTDRVHLNEAGNRLVAEKMWEAIRGL